MHCAVAPQWEPPSILLTQRSVVKLNATGDELVEGEAVALECLAES